LEDLGVDGSIDLRERGWEYIDWFRTGTNGGLLLAW